MAVRILAACLALLCLLAAELCPAQDFGLAVTVDKPQPVRRERNESAAIVRMLKPGEPVRVDLLQDGWYAVFPAEAASPDPAAAVGFVEARLVKPAAVPSFRAKVQPPAPTPAAASATGPAWGELRVVDRPLNIRKARSRFSEHVRTLKQGERIKTDFLKDGWVAVFDPAETVRSEKKALGFVNAKYLPAPSVKAKARPEPAPAAEAAAQKAWGELRVVDRKVNLRRARTPSSGHVRTLQPGDRVKVDFLKDDWYAVFDLNEPVRSEKKALGYVFRKLIDPPAQPVQAAQPARPPLPEPAPPSALAVPSPPPEPAGIVAPPARRPGNEAAAVLEQDKKVTLKPEPFEVRSRVAPRPDQTSHGFRYKILHRTETKRAGAPLLNLKVYLDVSVLPGMESLQDFATTLWKSEQGVKDMIVDIYVPGMDLDDLAFATATFSGKGLVEFWARQAALFGTKFLK
jgi:hypothetical protein